MAVRFFMSGNPPRLITTKPGYNANNLSLADIYKTFDSNWFDGAGIRWMFRINLGGIDQEGKVKTVMYPYALDHIPKIHLLKDGYSSVDASSFFPSHLNWNLQPNPGASFSSDMTTGYSASQVRAYTDRLVFTNAIGTCTALVFQS